MAAPTEEPIDASVNDLAPVESGHTEDEGRIAHLRKLEKKATRKSREPPSHDDELNIVALMDAFTIILVFLIKSYSSDPTAITQSEELKVPQSTSLLSVVEATPLMITRLSIVVNDKMVVRMKDGAVDASEKDNQLLIPRLRDALVEEAKHQKLMAQYNSKVKFEGMLLVVADKGTPFNTLTEVLYTAGQAEFGNYKFAVLKNE